MVLLSACVSSDVQEVSQGPGQHNVLEFGLARADIPHFNNFSFQESIVYLEAEAEVWSLPRECKHNREPGKPWAAGTMMLGF